MKTFELAGGTVTGRDHLQPLKWGNGQDAYCLIDGLDKGVAIAVVADGCGSGERSEVGAQIAARFVAYALWEYVPRYLAVAEAAGDKGARFLYWEDVRQDLLAYLRILAEKLGPNLKEAVKDHFLFTLIGFLVTPYDSFVFLVGDGVYAVNGAVARVGPFANNEPPYVGYGLLRPDQYGIAPEECRFKVPVALPTREVDSILVGSDGVGDLIAAAGKHFPSLNTKNGPVKLGPLSQFWEDGRYFDTTDAIRRTLALANNATAEPDWDEGRINRRPGLLPDDTTLAVIRRRQPPRLEGTAS
ncbi:MAG: protein phosphatase 2C domain-containing protein [Patescibacteria group bacterium]|nr:protein phosphatase 2C domain-containing protein [Patescibacteria group bacterium]